MWGGGEKGGGKLKSEDVRVVKETVLRSVGEIRVGSSPTPRIFWCYSSVEEHLSDTEKVCGSNPHSAIHQPI